MKKLIENSIKIYGIGHPDTITVFNIKTEEDRKHFRFKNLECIQKRTLTIWFDYEKDGVIIKEQNLRLFIPTGTESEIKDFILSKINETLNQ